MAQIPGTSAPASTTSTTLAAQPLDGSGGADLNVPVRMVYTPKDSADTDPFIVHYARQKYACYPNTPTFVPYLAMVMYLGDPRALNVPGGRPHQQARRMESERLSVHWGVYENSHEWARVPDLKAYPIDSDIPFNTVLDDPDGVNMSSKAAEVAQSQFMQTEMEKMAAQMRIMQGQLAQQQAAEGAREAAGHDPNVPLDAQLTTSQTTAPESMVGAHPTPSTAGRGKGRASVTTAAGVDQDGPSGVGS